jgi:hypothetical protein
MLRASFFILMAVSSAWAQATSTVQTDVFRKESGALQKAVDDAIGEVAGTAILQPSKATYIEEFGIVISLEVALEQPRNIFSNPTLTRNTVSSSVPERQRLVREKVKQFLMQKAVSLQSLNSEQSFAIAIHIFNSNPVDNPKLPAQMIFVVRKQEPTRVIMREL